jgi:hypothetical protein
VTSTLRPPSPPPAPRRPPSLLRVAGQTALIVGCVGTLFLQGARLGPWVYPLLFGVPLVLAAVRSPGAFRLWAIYTVSFVTFVELRASADDWGAPLQVAYVVQLDRLLGFGTLPTVWLQSLGRGMVWPAIGVHLSYYLVPPLVGMGLWHLATPDRFRRYMLAISATYLVGLVIHALLPTAPPWMAAQLGQAPAIPRFLYDGLHGLSPSFYTYGYKIAGTNEVAAMPSLHMATAWLAVLATRQTRVAWIAIAYALAMGLALTYLGEHYVVDELAGMALAWVAWRTIR